MLRMWEWILSVERESDVQLHGLKGEADFIEMTVLALDHEPDRGEGCLMGLIYHVLLFSWTCPMGLMTTLLARESALVL